MKNRTSIQRVLAAGLACVALGVAGNPIQAAENVFEAVPEAIDAYIYGYPLVTMEMTRRVITNVSAKPEGTRAPMGQLVQAAPVSRRRRSAMSPRPTPTRSTPPRSSMWAGAVGVSLPDMHGRYACSRCSTAGPTCSRCPASAPPAPARRPTPSPVPAGRARCPAGVKEYKSPTSIVWLLGRIYCTGTPEDYAAVHKLQDQVKLVPLSAYGKPYTPPAGKVDPSIDMKTAVREQVNALSADAYFTLLAKLMKDNPPNPADAPMLRKMAKLGIVPGQPFDSSKLGPVAKTALSEVPKIANEKIMLWLKEGILAGDSKLEHGWLFTTKTGEYGVNYIQRALITAIGLGANRPQDAIYPTSEGPSALSSYTGAKKYVMHFPKGQLPPAQGFWSLTMYDQDYFFVDNPLRRYGDLEPQTSINIRTGVSTNSFTRLRKVTASRPSTRR
jgi:hypothetical protein